MRLNQKSKSTETTHEGGPARRLSAAAQLRRSVMSCMLWEREFYEDGEEIADRIKTLVAKVDPQKVAAIAVEAREKMNLRHVPLLLVREMARLPDYKYLVANTLAQVIQRPDELSEFVSLYWKDGKQPLSGQVKKGLAKAFTKFDEYSLAKYNQDREVKLRDVLFLCHAKPESKKQEKLWKRLIDGELKTPDTWEVALSAGEDKKETWERLLQEGKLGALALLRNLRNMDTASVDKDMIRDALLVAKTDRVLPYRFIAAARFAPDLEPDLEKAMFRSLKEADPVKGRTCILIDVSGSMDQPISAKSDMSRLDAACGLAMLLRETCDEASVVTFSEKVAQVPARRGFALRDSIVNSQAHSGTYLGAAIRTLRDKSKEKFDRLIVITDEQSSDPVPNPEWDKSYIINVASNKNGVGYGPWTHLDGWSESIVGYIRELEDNSDE